MNFCLQPPNSALLSDDVIGGVILRSKSTNPLFVGFGGTSTTNTTAFSHFDQDRLVSSPNSERSAVKRKRSRDFGDLFASAFEGVIHETNRQRELRRRRQIRYRKKKEELVITLEQDTKQLCFEIQELQQRHQAITSSIPVKETAWNVAAQYFHLFCHGHRPPTSATTGLAPSRIQFAFMRATMASDIVHDAGRGVESLLVHWTRMTLWFKDFDYRLISLEQDSEDSVVATTTTTFSITDATLINMFPHLCEDERGPRQSLAKKLLGQRITMKGSTRFEWECAFGRVTRMLGESDMLTPMLHCWEALTTCLSSSPMHLLAPIFALFNRLNLRNVKSTDHVATCSLTLVCLSIF